MADTAPSLAAENAESGVVVTFVPATSLPSIPGGIRVVGLIGTGLTYKNISVTVTRGGVANGIDVLTPSALSLPSSIVDENFVNYGLNADYTLSLPQSISGNTPSLPAAAGTLSLNINGDGLQTIIFGTDLTPAAVAADIQAKIQALVPFNNANAQAYLTFKADYNITNSGRYTLTSGTSPIGSVVVSNFGVGSQATALQLGVANGGTETPGGSVNWGPAGAAQYTGSVNISALAFPLGINVDAQTFQIYANGNPTATTIVLSGTSVAPSSFTAIAGTVSLTHNSTAVTGTGTTFTTSLSVGQQVQFVSQPGFTYYVLSITDDTDLVLSTQFTGSTTGSDTLNAGTGLIQQLNAGFAPTITVTSTVPAVAPYTITLAKLPLTGDTLSIPGYTYTVGSPSATQYNLNPSTGVVTFNAAAASQLVNISYTAAPQLIASILVEGSQNYLQVTTVSTDNASLQIGNGTANASIGFTPGVLVMGPQEPNAGIKYSFTYGTPKISTPALDDYGPQLFTDLTSITAVYGPVPTGTNVGGLSTNKDGSTSTLSLGSQIVFTNSASTGGIVTVQCNPADGAPLAQFQNALNKLAQVSGVNIVVCLTPNPSLYPSIQAHVINASQPLNGLVRTAIVGLDPATTTVGSAISQATGFASTGNGRRFLIPWPASVQTVLGSNTVSLDGSYLAAAIAGLRINGNNDVATPLLRQQLVPFTTAAINLPRTTKLQLRDGGVTIVELQNGVVRITEDTTTDRSTVDNQEYSVTEIVDFVATTTKTLLNSIFIGVKILSSTTSIITATIQVLLNNLIALNIITDYQNVQAQVNALDPRQIDISFEIAPVFGLRYISVIFSLEQ